MTPRLDLPAGYRYVKGSSRDLVAVYAPVGATPNGFFKDGKPTTAAFSEERKHPVFLFVVNLQPGESTTLTINFVEPITNEEGRSLQSVAKLVPPVMFNPVLSNVVRGEFCKASK